MSLHDGFILEVASDKNYKSTYHWSSSHHPIFKTNSVHPPFFEPKTDKGRLDPVRFAAYHLALPRQPVRYNGRVVAAAALVTESQCQDCSLTRRAMNTTLSPRSDSLSALHHRLIESSQALCKTLSNVPYAPPEGTDLSVKSILISLLQNLNLDPIEETLIHPSIRDFSLACALLTSSQSSTHELLSWVPQTLSLLAESHFLGIAEAYMECFGERNERRLSELGLESRNLIGEDKRLVIELMRDVLPVLKGRIEESKVDKSSDGGDEFSAASAKVPVGYAIIASYQFRWFVTKVDYPYLGKLCNLVIPCALTALDHWSPDVKAQGMISFTHIVKNVNAAELGWYGDVILDACCQNIASADEIWYNVIEMSVLLVTSIQRSNPRSPWFEKILDEMLNHLERQPRNKERRIAWLRLVEPLLNAVGLVLLAHFRRFFPLFFQWMHANDDETVLLVLQRVHTVLRLTWIRNSPYIVRLVDELALLYKEAALRRSREDIRTHVIQILTLLQQCKGEHFDAAWEKHMSDPNLVNLASMLSGTYKATVIQ